MNIARIRRIHSDLITLALRGCYPGQSQAMKATLYDVALMVMALDAFD